MSRLLSNYVTDEDKIAILNKYVKQIINYSNSFNIIGRSTLTDIWERHILDSAQISNLLPDTNKDEKILDVGTGAGLPGVVLAIMGRENIILCEKSPKKVSFLRKMLKDFSINATIYAGKVQNFEDKKIKVIIARAFAPLQKLISSVIHLVKNDTTLILHKGKKYKMEIEEALKVFYFSYECKPSVSSKEGKVIIIRNIKKK